MTITLSSQLSEAPGAPVEKAQPRFLGVTFAFGGCFKSYRYGAKRALDVVSILVSLPIILPVIAVLAVAVACKGGQPFYSQIRVGKDGRSFRMWKLRSMIRDADTKLEAYLRDNPEAEMEWRTTQKLRNDPRITPLGRILRRSSLDELPQLWNVLKGEMSLVGPRPMMEEQKAFYPGQAYYKLRPGVTGFWQVAGRNRTTFEARAEYDALYEAGVSLRTDLKILLKTVGVIVRATGY